jgi:hypothetical protein
MKYLPLLVLILIGVALIAQDQPSPSPQNKVFCTRGLTITVCFALSSVSVFVPHDRAVILNSGNSWLLPDADWARLVAFGKTRNYEIPDAEGAK